MSRPTLVILDDDPTGTQTIRDLMVYTRWDSALLVQVLEKRPGAFFLLTNSRAMTPEQSGALHREIVQNLIFAGEAVGQDFLLVSRGDSTLRGHFPLETDTLGETMRAHGRRVDSVLVCPCFFDGGRITKDGIHYLLEGDHLIPVGETEFAKDATFGYSQSDLCAWIAEKSRGAVAMDACKQCDLQAIRSGQAQRLLTSMASPYVVIDGMEMQDMRLVAQAIFYAYDAGKRFIIRCAASLVQALCGQETMPPLDAFHLRCPDGKGGLVVVGSHVACTNMQLEMLKALDLVWVEFDITAPRATEMLRVHKAAQQAMRQDCTVVVYTSRRVHTPGGAQERLMFSVGISHALAQIVYELDVKPRFLIAKGGITSYDIATIGLQAQSARVIGSAAPGVPVWQLQEGSRFPGLPYIIFPGNVGRSDALSILVKRLL